MKNLLGAIAAAMLLGAGCAHERVSTTQTEAPASPQASVGTAGVSSGLACEVINGNAAEVSSSAPVMNESSDAWGGSSSSVGITEGKAGGGSVSDQSITDESVSDQSTIGGSVADQSVTDDSVSDQSVIDDSASETDTQKGTAIGGSGSEMDTSDKAAVDDSASETQSFEDTDMGGTGGGGG